MMTLDEAIDHAGDKATDTACGCEHAQLHRWLKELKVARETIDDLCETIELNLICDLGPTRLACIKAALDRARRKTPNAEVTGRAGAAGEGPR